MCEKGGKFIALKLRSVSGVVPYLTIVVEASPKPELQQPQFSNPTQATVR